MPEMKFLRDRRVKARDFSVLGTIASFLLFAALAALPALVFSPRIYFTWERLAFYVLFWAAIAAAFSALTVWMKRRTYDRPLQRLSEAASKVAAGDFSIYVEPIHTPDRYTYLDTLFLDFNKMVAELGSTESLKSDFIASVSHEIKTPLAEIRNDVTMMQRPELSEAQRQKYMRETVEAVDSLSSLITNILSLNKLENQQIDPAGSPFDLCSQLCDCILRFDAPMTEKAIDLETDMEDHAMISANPSLTEIVWNNLFSNAIKFSEQGGTITLKQTSDESGVTVTLSDNGCGMSPETQSRIFDRFYQGDSAHKQEGNGLGLALVKQAVQRLGGAVQVVSRLGEGTTFTVRLPGQ
ncbi:MAG: HAMP domain-containing sensor histidine kinase [Eubacteriales bacterium]|nr:HAMP domain-containing sensor histidine kinase [Eubacteriales bacterium]